MNNTIPSIDFNVCPLCEKFSVKQCETIKIIRVSIPEDLTVQKTDETIS